MSDIFSIAYCIVKHLLVNIFNSGSLNPSALVFNLPPLNPPEQVGHNPYPSISKSVVLSLTLLFAFPGSISGLVSTRSLLFSSLLPQQGRTAYNDHPPFFFYPV